MTKPLCSFPENERGNVASRRIRGETKGLGYWSAVNYENHNKTPKKVKKDKKDE